MPKFSQFVILSLLLLFSGGAVIGSHSLHSDIVNHHLNEDQSAQNKSWMSLPTEQFLEASSIFRKERDAGRRGSPSAHPPGSRLKDDEEFAHRSGEAPQARRSDARAVARDYEQARRAVKLSDFHNIIGAHRRRMSRHFVDSSNQVPVVTPPDSTLPSSSPSTSSSKTMAATAMPTGSLYPAYESHNVHITSYSDHSFLPRKFTRRKLHIVIGTSAASATESSSTDAALKREQGQLGTVNGQESSEEVKANHRQQQQEQKKKDKFEGDRMSLLSHIEDSGDGNIVQHESGQDSYTRTVRPISAEVLNTDQSSFIPNFEGFSDMFFPSIRSPKVFQIVTEDFARAVPIIASKRSREQLKHNCTMLLDSGYLPTGPETFAVLGRWGVLLCCMETGMVLCTLAIFSRECLYLFRHWPPETATLSCAALSVFPFTSICALTAAIFPHMYDVASALVMLYLPFSLVMYYELVAAYSGGCHVLWELLADQRMPLKGPPLCCILPPCCGQGPILTRKRQRLMRAFIYQLLGVPALLIGIIFICTLVGIHPGDRLEATNASPYLMLIQALSFVLGTYALVICVKLAANHLPQHGLRRKFTVFHLHYTVTRLQVIFFKLTGLTSSLPCIPPLSSMASGIYMSCAMLIGQCFLMSTVSQYFFLHPPPVSPIPGNILNNGKHVHSERPCANCEQSPLAPQNVEYAEETFSSDNPCQPSSGLLATRAHANLGRAYSHPVTRLSGVGVGVPANIQSLSLGNATGSTSPLSTNRQPANRANLSLDLKHTHTMTLERRRRRQRLQRSESLEGLDLDRSYGPRQPQPTIQFQLQQQAHHPYFETEHQQLQLRQLQERRELLERRERFERQERLERRGLEGLHELQRHIIPEEHQRRRHELFNPMMTLSLDEALRLRELRERQTRQWRVSVAGGEHSLNGGRGRTGGWPVSSLEEVTPLTASDEFDSDLWINESRWLRSHVLSDCWSSPPRRTLDTRFRARSYEVPVVAPEWPAASVGGNHAEEFC